VLLPELVWTIIEIGLVQLPALAISTDSDSTATRTDSDSAATRTNSDETCGPKNNQATSDSDSAATRTDETYRLLTVTNGFPPACHVALMQVRLTM